LPKAFSDQSERPDVLPLLSPDISEKEMAAPNARIPPIIHDTNVPVPDQSFALSIEWFLRNIPIPTTLPKTIVKAAMKPIFLCDLIDICFPSVMS